jgi:hypothetical protein
LYLSKIKKTNSTLKEVSRRFADKKSLSFGEGFRVRQICESAAIFF